MDNRQAPLPQLDVYLNSTGQYTFAIFVILLLAYAYYRWRIGEKTKNESYSVADETKRFTWFVAGGAIIATMFASDTPFVVGDFIRSQGWRRMELVLAKWVDRIFPWNLPLCRDMGAIEIVCRRCTAFAPFWRKTGKNSYGDAKPGGITRPK